MTKPKRRIRTVVLTISGGSLAMGMLMLGYGLIISGCAPVNLEIKPVLPAKEINSLADAEQSWRADKISQYQPIWIAEKGAEGDSFSAGLAAYHLASASGDSAWSNAAIDAFDEVLKHAPDLTMARAWRGSAHALHARDFPIQGILQIIPGPGFVRLYHVRKSFSDLDKSVEDAPKDPVIRLIRGSTYVAMPSIFGGADIGRSDFEMLRVWELDPASNPEYEDILRSKVWQENYYQSRARAMAKVGEDEDALRSWENLASITDHLILQELAKWHIISLTESR